METYTLNSHNGEVQEVDHLGGFRKTKVYVTRQESIVDYKFKSVVVSQRASGVKGEKLEPYNLVIGVVAKVIKSGRKTEVALRKNHVRNKGELSHFLKANDFEGEVIFR